MEASQAPTKICTKCGRQFPATVGFFSIHSAGRLRNDCRVCAAAHGREHRQANREEINARQREKYWLNHEKRRESDRRRRELHCEERKARRKENQAKETEQHRKWADAHREHLREYRLRRRLADPEPERESCRRRRAACLGSPGNHTLDDIRAQYGRQAGRCFWCHRKVQWRDKHVDHVTPLSKGGSDGPENLVISCAHCNHRKSAKHPMDWNGMLC